MRRKSALTRIERFAAVLLEKTGEDKTTFASYISSNAPKDFGRFTKAWDALRNNLNIAACLGAIFEVIGSNPTAPMNAEQARSMLTALGSLLYALGLNLFTACDIDATVPDDILALAKHRWEAKQAHDWDKADQLRAPYSLKDGSLKIARMDLIYHEFKKIRYVNELGEY